MAKSASTITADAASKKKRIRRTLSEALEQANRAVIVDTSGSVKAATGHYDAACSKLNEALRQTSKLGDQDKLRNIISTYENRIAELGSGQSNELQGSFDDSQVAVFELPAEHQNADTKPGTHIVLNEKAAILPRWHEHRHKPQVKTIDWLGTRTLIIIGLLALALVFNLREQWDFIGWLHQPKMQSTLTSKPSLPLKDIPARLEHFQECSIKQLNKDTDLKFLQTAKPPKVSEYEIRRNRLAQALVIDGLDAFMVEPGYTLQYYADVNQPRWEVWEPEERPFVMVVRPYRSHDGNIVANTSFLVPSFEKERARLLEMPFEKEPTWITYEEHWNPYATLIDSAAFSSFTKRQPKIMVDEEMRDFISRGMASNGFDVYGLGGEVERVRQIKSEPEVGILQAVNTGTVEALRAMRKCLKLGLSEDDVMQVLDNTMRSAGMDPFFDIVLFDDDASNPHGGTDGSKILEEETMVLIDVGAHLYGYSSDICRSFFGPWLSQPKHDIDYSALSEDMKEKLKVWDIVFEAQTASLYALHENSTAAAVDIAARNVITEAGYGRAFTHRVGHGIGIKAHESPYLNKGNVNATLKAGMTFTSEPGIYLVEKFGVRHEDVLLVQEHELPKLLTGRRAKDPWNP